MRRLLLAVPLALSLLFLWRCQNYELTPVSPVLIAAKNEDHPIVGKANAPNIMIVLDRSGSMMDPTDPGDPACKATTPGNVTTCSGVTIACNASTGTTWQSGDCVPAACSSKAKDLLKAMTDPSTGFVTQNPCSARLGLLEFGGDCYCGSGRIVLDVGDNNSDAIRTEIQNKLTFGGGTPSAEALRGLKSIPSLAAGDRDNFVLLLTDGVPNCNKSLDCSTCVSTATSCPINVPDAGLTGGVNCLDDASLLSAITELRQQTPPVRTIVIGFGKDTADPTATKLMNDAAIAGGFPQPATPGGTSYYQANNLAQLQGALKKICESLAPCHFVLDPAPQSPDLLVAVQTQNGQDTLLERGKDWDFSKKPDGTIDLAGVDLTKSRCDAIQGFKASDKVSISFRYLVK